MRLHRSTSLPALALPSPRFDAAQVRRHRIPRWFSRAARHRAWSCAPAARVASVAGRSPATQHASGDTAAVSTPQRPPSRRLRQARQSARAPTCVHVRACASIHMRETHMRAGAHTGGNADTHKASPSMPHSASVSARVTTCLASMSPFGELSCIKTDAPCESQTAAAGKGRKGHEVLGRGRQAAGARTSRRRRGAWARRRHTTRTWGWLLPVPARMTTAQKHAAAAMIINVAGSHCHNQGNRTRSRSGATRQPMCHALPSLWHRGCRGSDYQRPASGCALRLAARGSRGARADPTVQLRARRRTQQQHTRAAGRTRAPPGATCAISTTHLPSRRTTPRTHPRPSLPRDVHVSAP